MSKRNKKITNQATVGAMQPQARSRGAAMIVGIIIVTVLLLVASIFGYLALTNKNEPQLVVDTNKVTADDLLTTGKTNSELTTDYRIIAAGLERDTKQRDAASAALNDEAQLVGEGVTSSTTVETARLSQLQTEFIKETDRRLAKLNSALAEVEKLTVEQKTLSSKHISDEITILTGLKTKAASETDQAAFLKDRDELNKEYDNYRMAVSQMYMLLWVNDQRVLAEKANVLGGKLQERLNDASNHGTSIAHAQTILNTYQTSKQTAKDTNATMLKQLMTLRPNAFEANKAVLLSYLNNLKAAHDELKKTSDDSKEILLDIQKY